VNVRELLAAYTENFALDKAQRLHECAAMLKGFHFDGSDSPARACARAFHVHVRAPGSVQRLEELRLHLALNLGADVALTQDWEYLKTVPRPLSVSREAAIEATRLSEQAFYPRADPK
jgi:hypothetical protein